MGFYLLALFFSCAAVVIIRRHGFDVEIINFGDVDLILQVYNRNLVYILLCLIDICHLGMTAWGTALLKNKILLCYKDLPNMSNFILILVVLGYIYFCRIFVTLIHYKFGVYIYRFIRRRFRRFHQFDLDLQTEFPIYLYSDYLKLLKL